MVGDKIKEIIQTLPPGVKLCAVSKYHPSSLIQEAYDAGQRIFGESHVQELQQKQAMLPNDIEWHFIGHLQTNKVKYIAPYVSLIHSVDSIRLLNEINKQALKHNRTIPCLLQLHVAEEETKFGFSTEECMTWLQTREFLNMPGIAIAGIMCMATNTDDEVRIRKDFNTAHNFYLQCKAAIPELAQTMTICSWGMSGDYPIAIEEGSNLIRVGSFIFGEREY